MRATKGVARSGKYNQKVLDALNQFMLETIDIACNARMALEPPDDLSSSDEEEE